MVLSRFEELRPISSGPKTPPAAGDVEAQVNAICARALAQFYLREWRDT
jgi:hypothetical protein